MFTIGEFSKATGLTVKTLRFYHEQGVLVPPIRKGSAVDGSPKKYLTEIQMLLKGI